ncbi:MAG: HNH endonuclease [Gemmatimonadaceae bacterium]|nr:HNH endonuclease [Gemmatimonadaceae bacterium]
MTSPNTRTRLIWRDGKKVRAHRWIMEQYLGRKLLPGEHVHHRNGNPLDNRLENLQVLSPKEHMQWHKAHDRVPKPCANCGQVFTPTQRQHKRQKCCSPECAMAMRVVARKRQAASSRKSSRRSASGSSKQKKRG